MSDQPTNPKYQVIDPDAIVNIKMSSGFYNKLQEAVQFLVKGKEDVIPEVYKQISSKNITDPFADVLQTLFILLKEFQTEAEKAGFVSEKTSEEIETFLKTKYPEKDLNFDVKEDGIHFTENDKDKNTPTD